MDDIVEQKIVTVRQDDGQYSNFFFTPGSIGSLQEHFNKGWHVKFIKDNGREAVIVFERVLNGERDG
jgi:hypothetical protein